MKEQKKEPRMCPRFHLSSPNSMHFFSFFQQDKQKTFVTQFTVYYAFFHLEVEKLLMNS